MLPVKDHSDESRYSPTTMKHCLVIHAFYSDAHCGSNQRIQLCHTFWSIGSCQDHRQAILELRTERVFGASATQIQMGHHFAPCAGHDSTQLHTIVFDFITCRCMETSRPTPGQGILRFGAAPNGVSDFTTKPLCGFPCENFHPEVETHLHDFPSMREHHGVQFGKQGDAAFVQPPHYQVQWTLCQ